MKQIITNDGLRGWKKLIILDRENNGTFLISPRLNNIIELVDSNSIWFPNKAFKAETIYPVDNMCQCHNCLTLRVNKDFDFHGIYSYNEEGKHLIFQDQLYLPSNLKLVDYNYVIVRVKIWGRIHKHKLGYKSEFAYPEIIICHNLEIVLELSKTWVNQTILPIQNLKDYFNNEKLEVINCSICNEPFILTEAHKIWFRARNFPYPKKCKDCAKLKSKDENVRQKYIRKYLEAKEANFNEPNR